MCSHLIGRPYRYGDNDCIHLVIEALDCMGLKNPGVKSSWYQAGWREILRDFDRYCNRVDFPKYDGDIVVLSDKSPTFGVVWQHGILFINQATKAVDWKPTAQITIRRSYRTKKS
jgi:hypothetical protein